MALVLATSLTFMPVMPAFAADGDPEPEPETPAVETPTYDYDYPITVTGLETGDVAHFYKVIEWVGETSDHSDVSGWRAVAPFSTYLTQERLTAILVGTKGQAAVGEEGDPDYQPAVAAVDPTGITSEIAGELAKLASGDGTVAEEDGGTATLQNPSSGMWMALIDPANVNTTYNPVFVSADYKKETGHEGTAAVTGAFADAVAKKSTLTLTKTAANAADYNNDNAKTTAVGDTVTFTVNTTIPAYGYVYTNPHFVLTDSLTDLKLVTSSIAVNPAKYTDGNGAEQATYTLTSATEGGYTITFNEAYLKTLKTATDVTVTYNAIVTDTAAKAVNEEDNQVSIEYSHNPNKQSDYDLKKDTTQHYTFSIDAEGAGEGQNVTGKKTSEVVKIGVDAKGDPITQTTETSAITSTETWSGPLEGAVFGLFTDQACNTPYKAKKADGTAGDTAMTATTGADGRMNFAGLDAGTYYLKEISAPAGFVTNTTVHTIVIAAQTESVKVTEWWNGSAWVSTDPGDGAKSVTYDTDILKSYTVTIDGQETAKYTFTNEATANSTDIKWEEAELVEKPFELENIQGVELPSTGGMGTRILYTIGGIMLVGGAIALVSRKRVANMEK